MCNKAVDNYAHAFKFVLDCFEDQKLGNNATNTSPSVIKFVPECYKTQENYYKFFDTCLFVLDYFIFYFVPDRLKTKEMCDKPVSENHFVLKYYLDRHRP